MLQPSKNFLDIANSNCSTRWRLEIVLSCKVEINRVLKVFPLLVGKETAKGRVAECDRFVRAESLHTSPSDQCCSQPGSVLGNVLIHIRHIKLIVR